MTDMVNDILKDMKNKQFDCRKCEINNPDVLNDDKIIKAERDLKYRIKKNRGYDIIRDIFFVEEELHDDFDYLRDIFSEFDSFDEYMDYCEGDIYKNASYYLCPKERLDNVPNNVFKKIYALQNPFTTEVISDMSVARFTPVIEKNKNKVQNIKKWLKKFYSCTDVDSFVDCIIKFYSSSVYDGFEGVRHDFFILNYIQNAPVDNREEIVIESLRKDTSWHWMNDVLNQLIYKYGSKVSDTYLEYCKENYARGSFYKKSKVIRMWLDYVSSIDNNRICKSWTLDSKSYYFKVITSYDGHILFTEYYEHFEEIIEKFYNGNLCGVDLSKYSYLSGLDVDYDKYAIDENTKLPNCNEELIYRIYKYWANDYFYVQQYLEDKNKNIVDEIRHKFKYFVDFVYFMKNDLSAGQFIFCKGLKNITDFSIYNLTDAQVVSDIKEKIGLPITSYDISEDKKFIYKDIASNEEKSEIALANNNHSVLSSVDIDTEIDSGIEWEFKKHNQRVCYISDLHLIHRIMNNKESRTKEDIYSLFDSIVSKLLSIQLNYDDIVVFAGDTSSSIDLFEMFLKVLRCHISDSMAKSFFFTLGNHELWDSKNNSLKDTISVYKEIIEKYGMKLLHNNIFYKEYGTFGQHEYYEISEAELQTITVEELSQKLNCSQFTIFGGIGFAGCNCKFNADNGMYRGLITREEELLLSDEFKRIYLKVEMALDDRDVVIATHNPITDWMNDGFEHRKFAYISGHSHMNHFYDDGEYRVFADNQVGYKGNQTILKWFYTDKDIDIFSKYDDGIYEISSEDYNNFYHGKNIALSFGRTVSNLYMIKKNEYYMFMCKLSEKGNLCILNGGAIKKVYRQDIEFYYENMDEVIKKIKTPLDKYSAIQNEIASNIIKIGGSGYIHGCIIDIDFFTHIYVNPFDLTITGYWASNIIDKVVYFEIDKLIKDNCPRLYDNYIKLIGGNNGLCTISNMALSNTDYIYVDSTDIYKASREIKKMQKVYNSILTTWIESEKDKLVDKQKKPLTKYQLVQKNWTNILNMSKEDVSVSMVNAALKGNSRYVFPYMSYIEYYTGHYAPTDYADDETIQKFVNLIPNISDAEMFNTLYEYLGADVMKFYPVELWDERKSKKVIDKSDITEFLKRIKYIRALYDDKHWEKYIYTISKKFLDKYEDAKYIVKALPEIPEELLSEKLYSLLGKYLSIYKKKPNWCTNEVWRYKN